MKKKPMAVDPKRSYNMSRIKSKDTSIEVALRKALWHSGIRYRKNYTKLPGTPDIAITKHKIAIFCDGEFWHGKDWESKKGDIKSNRDFWIEKIERNIDRDIKTSRAICWSGWTVIRFWGNEIRDNLASCVDDVKDAIFQSNVNAHSSDLIICELYPCWLLRNGEENNVDDSAFAHSKIKDLPCFESTFEIPCQIGIQR